MTPPEPERQLSGAELTGRLQTIAADLDAAQQLHRVLGWYCHESRNLLNSLKMSLYLAKRAGEGGDPVRWTDVESAYGEMERFTDRLHQICRPSSITPIRAPLDLLFDERRMVWAETLEAKGCRLALRRPDEPAIGSFDPSRLGPALDDLVAWRARRAARGMTLKAGWGTDEGGKVLEIVWTESASRGASQLEEARLPSGSEGPSMLSLPLLTRVIALHGGTVTSDEHEGWRLTLRWPSDARIQGGVSC